MDTNGARAFTAPGEQEPSPAEAFRRLQKQVEELQAYFAHFVSAKVDSVVLSARRLAIWAVLGVVGLIALAALIVTAIVLVLHGVANGLAVLFAGRLWLGQLVAGSGILIMLVLSILIGVRTWQTRWRQQKVQQYDERQFQQRAAFGHSVEDRATEERSLQQQG
jgi:hypothetical protein